MSSRLEPEYDARLVEAAVLAALTGRAEEPAFRAGRDRLYTIAEPEPRERAFGAFHARWFERLRLHRPFHEALAERPEIGARCVRWLVVRASGGRDEAADLLVAPATRPTLLVRVTSETVVAPERLRLLLRRELLHVADMLDPRFAYTPDVPAGVTGPGRERLVRENYRVLWDTWVDGRLVRCGMAPADARARRFAEFARAFSHLGPAAEIHFERFFGARDLTHAELLAFAAGVGDGAPRCPLCAAPAPASPSVLAPEALALLAGDFPWWRRQDGVCSRCVELYSARAAMSS